MSSRNFYKNNSGLKAANVAVSYTEEQIQEYIKCRQDPVYFIENYAKIVSLDEGVITFKLYDYQKNYIRALHENTRTLTMWPRQQGKSTTVAAYTAWYINFNEHKSAAILANKQSIAVEIFRRVQFIIENLPPWLQQGISEWNKTSLTLENGSVCFAAATSPSAVRGKSISLLILDEMAHMNPRLADEFIKSVFPTISSSETAKMAIISTPNGLNHFYKLWTDAESQRNDFITLQASWRDHPKRNQAWADKHLKEVGPVTFTPEYECSFVGSSYTLIDGNRLATIPFQEPFYKKANLEIFKKPIDKHSYVITVDTSRGAHQDFSAFTIIDVSAMPYEVVGIFKDNTISTLEYPHLIFNTAREYNNAYLLIETNDLGEEVSNVIWHEYEYENVYFTDAKGLAFRRGYPGVRTTSKVKSLGCSVLKELIEKDQLILNSFRIIEELGVFVLSRKSYAADDTSINDDLCTCLWLFAWLSKQDVFQDVININLRGVLTEKKQEYIDQMMTPFGFYDDGLQDINSNSTRLPDHDYHGLTPDQIELLTM